MPAGYPVGNDCAVFVRFHALNDLVHIDTVHLAGIHSVCAVRTAHLVSLDQPELQGIRPVPTFFELHCCKYVTVHQEAGECQCLQPPEVMLYYTSERIDDRQKPVTCHDLDLVPELRTSPLLHENPYPLEEVLNDLPKPFVVQLLDLVHREGKPKRNAAKTVMAAWLAQNAPMLAKEMPPCASFSFVEVFDKAQRDVYKYLHRKYDMETDWYSGVQYPAGSGLLNENELVFYFPDDRITAALTKRGFNRCLNGYIPTKSK